MGVRFTLYFLIGMKKILLFSLFHLLIKSSASQNGTRITSLQIIFRHGDRSPVLLYPNDPNTKDDWPAGLGQLTLLGKEQLYTVGNYLRERYKDFITSNPNEVTVHSSHADRCIISALTHMAALYRPTKDWMFDDSLAWQPIPIHSVPEHRDKYLSAKPPCHRADKETKIYLDEKVPPLLDEHKEMVENLTQKSGLKVDNAINLFLLKDTLEIERKYNKKVPYWAEYYWEELDNVTNVIFQWFLKPPIVQRLRIGPLIGRLSGHMTRKDKKENSKVKVHVYSTHDYEVAVLLEALKISDNKRPPYAATLVLELHENEEGQEFIRFIYLNSPTPEYKPEMGLQTLILEGCEEFCPLSFFKEYTAPLVPHRWKAECNSHVSNHFRGEEESHLFDVQE